jgi:hypothetical protein
MSFANVFNKLGAYSQYFTFIITKVLANKLEVLSLISLSSLVF